jgi:hypothetical protein
MPSREGSMHERSREHISIFTIFLPVPVQACTSIESSQASSYVQILTSTSIKIISVNTQPEKKIQQMPMSTLSPSKHTGMIRIRFIYLYCLVIVVDNDKSIFGLASPFSHKFAAFKLISYPISILLLHILK